jgi:hypothetical protein
LDLLWILDLDVWIFFSALCYRCNTFCYAIQGEATNLLRNQNPEFDMRAKNISSKTIPLLSLAAMLSGCTVLTYTGPNGEQFTRASVGANGSIQSLAVEADTNGVRRVELRGYQNDSSQALSAVTEAAVRGAVQGAK